MKSLSKNIKPSEFFDGRSCRMDMYWAAMAYAHRKNNGSYYKQDTEEHTCNILNEKFPARTANRTHVFHALTDPSVLEDDDYKLGHDIQEYFKGRVFQLLTGEVSSFDKLAITIAGYEDFEELRPNLNHYFAISASLPSSYDRYLKKDRANDIIREANSQHFGSITDKVDLPNVTVIRTVYSKNYGVYFATCLYDKNHVIYFSTKHDLKTDEVIHIKGTIKSHRNNGQTQLNRVKIQ
jgi:hypothetical protein